MNQRDTFQIIASLQLIELEHQLEHKYDLGEDHPLRRALQTARIEILDIDATTITPKGETYQ